MLKSLFSLVFTDPGRENRLSWVASASSVAALAFFGVLLGVNVPDLPDTLETGINIGLAIFVLVTLTVFMDLIADAVRSKNVPRCIALIATHVACIFIFGPILDYFSNNYFAVRGVLLGWLVVFLLYAFEDVWSSINAKSE